MCWLGALRREGVGLQTQVPLQLTPPTSSRLQVDIGQFQIRCRLLGEPRENAEAHHSGSSTGH